MRRPGNRVGTERPRSIIINPLHFVRLEDRRGAFLTHRSAPSRLSPSPCTFRLLTREGTYPHIAMPLWHSSTLNIGSSRRRFTFGGTVLRSRSIILSRFSRPCNARGSLSILRFRCHTRRLCSSTSPDLRTFDLSTYRRLAVLRGPISSVCERLDTSLIAAASSSSVRMTYTGPVGTRSYPKKAGVSRGIKSGKRMPGVDYGSSVRTGDALRGERGEICMRTDRCVGILNDEDANGGGGRMPCVRTWNWYSTGGT